MKLFPHALPLVSLAMLGLVGPLGAQNIQPCGTDEVRRALIDGNPDLLRIEAEHAQGLREYLQSRAGQRDSDDSTVYVLPLVFHILYDPTQTSDAHNVSDQRIFDQMAKLNQDYSASNPDLSQVCCGYQSRVGDAKIRWQLATKDPFGNCTNGINRITSLRSTNAGNYSKLDPWPRDHYVNVWVINKFPSMDNGSTLLGFSQLPPDVQDGPGYMHDGVIMVWNAMPGGGIDGTTLSHELGHFLDLQHTWGNTNDPEVSCGDDGIADTPETKGHRSCNIYDSFCSYQAMDTAYTFQDMTTSSGTTDPTPVPALHHAQDPGAQGIAYSAVKAVGVSANSMRDGSFSFANWGTGAEDGATTYAELTGQLSTAKYYEFTVTPGEGRSMTLTGLTFPVDRSATGPRTFAVRSSRDNFASNLSATVDTSGLALVTTPGVVFFRRDSSGTAYSVNVKTTPAANFTNLPTPVTFRIYAWNAEDADGWFAVNPSLKVLGNFGIIENVQNFMEYSGCSNMFTKGQTDHMRGVLNMSTSSRNNLWTEANHAFTGINGHEVACAPEADFYTRTPFVCAGSTVQFKSNVKRATATSWAWTFDGGTPATSNQQNPTVSFSEPGPHAVTLTVANDNGSSTTSKWNAVYIGANYTELAHPLGEPFDSQDDFSRWPNQNLEGNASYWHWTNETGHDAPGCAKLNASNTFTLTQDIFSTPDAYLHDVDNLITPSLALPFHQGITVSFWYAYSSQTGTTADITETLKVYASSNCGNTWLNRLTLSGVDLVTAGVRSPGYVPAANEWRQASFTLPNLFAGDGVRLKFEFTTGLYPNDLFIDDVNISSTNVGIDELAQSGALGLVPNPATNSLTVMLDMAGSAKGTLSFQDMTGRTMHSQEVAAGVEQLDLDLAGMGLSSGVYLVRLKHDHGQRVERLVVR